MIEKIQKLIYSRNREDVLIGINMLGRLPNKVIREYIVIGGSGIGTIMHVFSDRGIYTYPRLIEKETRAFFVFDEFVLSAGLAGLIYHSLESFYRMDIKEYSIIRL